MNRFLLPLLILLWSLAYSWFWNCHRKPYCSGETIIADTTSTVVAPSPPVDTLKVASEEEQILFTPLDVYFDINQFGIKKTAEVDSFITTAKKYLEKYPDKKLLITGHSDSDGSDELNQRLSENRALKTKEFLVKDGIKATQIVTDGKGEKEPAASNDTAEGKAKNRRSTIRLKE
ncbi:OmpA family protein [Emticicia sp. SJ17W-69]|uniref:OmpA family protein n=1 Tax=Emticicia sp. SJ17W-69 TaxID=3421657 RepID=UPI003EB8C5D2